jgi:hypothetical protein
VGHWTQIIDERSKELGVGKYRDNNGKVFLVLRYRPAGNISGTYPFTKRQK